MADRAGRLEDRPKRIKAEVLPYDTCDVDALLADLAVRGFVIRYHAAGVGYIQVTEFSKHQEPHVKEKASTIPPPDSHRESTVQKPLNPIPDSGFLIPDSKDASAEVPPEVSPDVWQAWKRHRGKALSSESVRRQTLRLADLKAKGYEPNEVILQSIDRGWSGLFEIQERVGTSRKQSVSERRVSNIDTVTGKRNGQHIDSTAELVDSGPVLTLPSDLREPGRDDVGRRRS